ncbi:MAG: DUF2892 domain-containing protein [Gammaproteobacteria bacterium]|nr:DUF2892 domain-containing protein [Gammaproteobacteria bacterium]
MGLRWQPNVGRFDQILRLGIGIAMVWVGFIDSEIIGDSLMANLLGLFGLFNLVAAVLRVCPFYTLADINTNNQDD